MCSLPVVTVMPPPIILCIEGSIGAGKSSVMTSLESAFAGDPTVLFVHEPVENWCSTGMLSAMYSGTLPKCTFQLTALMTRGCALLRALAVPGARVIVCERSPTSDRLVFARSNLNKNSVEKRAYDLAHAELMACMPTHTDTRFVYLYAPVDVLIARMQRRNRSAETHHTDFELMQKYLSVLESAHDDMLQQIHPNSVTVVNAVQGAEDVARQVAAVVGMLLQSHQLATNQQNTWIQYSTHVSLPHAQLQPERQSQPPPPPPPPPVRPPVLAPPPSPLSLPAQVAPAVLQPPVAHEWPSLQDAYHPPLYAARAA